MKKLLIMLAMIIAMPILSAYSWSNYCPSQINWPQENGEYVSWDRLQELKIEHVLYNEEPELKCILGKTLNVVPQADNTKKNSAAKNRHFYWLRQKNKKNK